MREKHDSSSACKHFPSLLSKEFKALETGRRDDGSAFLSTSRHVLYLTMDLCLTELINTLLQTDLYWQGSLLFTNRLHLSTHRCCQRTVTLMQRQHVCCFFNRWPFARGPQYRWNGIMRNTRTKRAKATI